MGLTKGGLFPPHIITNTKMASDKISMPVSTAGITRYFDEYKSKIEFKPGHIIVLAVVILVVILLLHAFGYKLLGI